MNRHQTGRRVLLSGAVIGAAILAISSIAQSGATIDAARFDEAGLLLFPDNTDRWVTLGSGLGGDYEAGAFDPSNPGTMSHVQMEPTAYEFFQRNGYYAEGTMLLLSFYHTLEKPEPNLRGFAQGELAQREIHLIDARRFQDEGRAFFVYPTAETRAAAALPVGSECVVCHSEHGAYDGTFTQFYPIARDRLTGIEAH